ncbi:hypothetical protein H6F67_00565 [Microcoleus sp. FACHB-1515]|uniref:hypothetical protein n=1 Tax=Cyanophyceae TaxID=3028117 RepID=UPI001685F461|nr:hypothetical protein [Microcoleus sp. FACHB-1515]MBD2088365.1 hypothetical protein [Microcoleus sp. FACHB-1515]
MSTFIRFENRLINLAEVSHVRLDESPRQIWVCFPCGDVIQVEGDRAEQLWNVLQQHATGAIDEISIMASLDRAQMLDTIGTQMNALQLAAEVIVAAGAKVGDCGSLDISTLVAYLLREGKQRYENDDLETVEANIDRLTDAWEAATRD